MEKPSDYQWDEVREIGRGSFGIILLGIDKKTGKQMAVKKLPADRNSEKLKEAMKEMKLLSRLNNKHIVNFEGYQSKGDSFYIFMEYVSGGSIEYQVNKFGKLSEELTRKYSKQILKGLGYLHGKRVVHGDIKCANILSTENGTCKLADFGSAQKILRKNQALNSLIGSVYWMAPEVIKQNGIDFYSDIWSFGATVYEMLVGYPPFFDTKGNQFKIMHKIAATKILPVFPEPENEGELELSNTAKDFVYSCLRRNPNDRLTVQQLLEHPFIVKKRDDGSHVTMRIINTKELNQQGLEKDRMDGMVLRILEKRKENFPHENRMQEGMIYSKDARNNPRNMADASEADKMLENFNDGRRNKIKDEETISYFDEKGNEVFFKKFLDPEFEPIIEMPEDPYERLNRIKKRGSVVSTLSRKKKTAEPRSQVEDIQIDLCYKEDDLFNMQIEKVNNFLDDSKEEVMEHSERKHVKFQFKDKNQSDSEFIETDEDIDNAISNCLDLFGTNIILPKESQEDNPTQKNNPKSGFLYL